MTQIQEKLLDAYAYEMDIAASGFEMMGRLLDIDYIKNRIELLDVSELYIYGGGYLGIQFYQTAHKLIKIPAVIDRRGKLIIDILDIPVIDVREFKKIYEGQKVIIASIRFFCEIQRELSDFVPKDQIVFLGEFLGGILK